MSAGTWYVKNGRTAVNWGSDVSGGVATVDIAKLVVGTANEQWYLYARTGQAVTADQVAAAQAETTGGAVPAALVPYDGEAPGGTGLDSTYAGLDSAVYNVKDHGAKGDGSTDDTASIQALINAVGVTKPATVYFPPGVYIVSGLALRSNVTLTGAGSGGYGLATNYATRCSVLKLKAGSSLPVIGDFGTSTPVYSVAIRDLQIDGNKANQTPALHGIQLYDAGAGQDSLWNVRDCLVINCKGDGISIGANRRGNHVLNCQVYTCDGNGIMLGSTDNAVAHTIIGSSGGYGISVTASTQHIIGCDIFSNLVGINISSTSAAVLVSNCGIDRSQRQAIFCAGSRNVITGSTFQSNSQAGNGSYSTIDLDYPNTTALGNVVSSNTFTSDSTLTNKPDYSVKHNIPVIALGNTFGSPAPHTTGAFINSAIAVILERSQALADGSDLNFGTTNGNRLATTTSQKLGFWGATPVVRPTSSDALRAALQNVGLLPSGGSNPLAVADADVSNTAAISQAKVSYLRPTGSIAQTFPREVASISDLVVLVSGRLSLVAVDLPSGKVVTSISFLSRSTAGASLTNQWFALFDNSASPVLLRQTVDDTTTAWAANAVKTLALSSTFTTTYSGLHYLGIMVAGTTVPTMAGINVGSGTFASITPVIAGTSTTGLTTPGSFTSPASTPAGTTTVPYAYVS
jgi:hypothetical protein